MVHLLEEAAGHQLRMGADGAGVASGARGDPGGDQFGDVVQHPRRIERIDAGPQPGGVEIGGFRHRDETVARGLLGVGRHSRNERETDHANDDLEKM